MFEQFQFLQLTSSHGHTQPGLSSGKEWIFGVVETNRGDQADQSAHNPGKDEYFGALKDQKVIDMLQRVRPGVSAPSFVHLFRIVDVILIFDLPFASTLFNSFESCLQTLFSITTTVHRGNSHSCNKAERNLIEK